MSTVWQRLRRWLREPLIRLPAPGLTAAALRPGDRLQVGSRLWRVGSKATASAFELAAVEGPPDRARLDGAEGRWTFDTGGGAIELDSAAIVHFPVSSQSSM